MIHTIGFRTELVLRKLLVNFSALESRYGSLQVLIVLYLMNIQAVRRPSLHIQTKRIINLNPWPMALLVRASLGFAVPRRGIENHTSNKLMTMRTLFSNLVAPPSV